MPHIDILVPNGLSMERVDRAEARSHMYLSPLWSLLTVGLALGTMAIMLRRSSLLAREIDVPSSVRVATIDGLRAYLAFGVFLTHALSIRDWSITGIWRWPPSTFYTLCGTIPVTLFFMLTGYLFWGKAIRGSVQLRPRTFYLARLRRLAPLYLFLLLPFTVLVALRSGFAWHASLSENAGSLLCWATIGLCGHPPINGIADAWILNTPIWTLQYEWYFYLCLPFLAWCATPFRSIALAIFGLIALHRFPDYGVMRNFLFGGLAAFVIQRWNFDALRSPLASIFAMALLGATAVTGAVQSSFLHSTLVFPTLLVACAGNSFFGLLSMRPARALGVVSYSLYLGHCLVLQFTTMLVLAAGWMPEPESSAYWAYVGAVTIAVVLLSAAGFRFIEFPFLVPWNVNKSAERQARMMPLTEPDRDLPPVKRNIARA